jgi:hypothetical protein
LIVCAISFDSPAQELEIAKGLKGSVKQGVYTSPDRDYGISIPSLWGGRVRDGGVDKIGSFWCRSQVIFTDDFGLFYRVVSFGPQPCDTLTPDALVERGVFHNIQQKKPVWTSKGRGWRVIDVEKHGAEIIVTDSTGKRSQPDLVTANAVFVADNGRVYHVTVGLPVAFGVTVEQRAEQLPNDLDNFLKGFKPLEKPLDEAK